jgi:hypothetical protein
MPAGAVDSGYVVRAIGGWSWRAFGWGSAACGVFVIAVLAMWSYVHAH